MATYAESIANVSITRATRTPSQQGFGVPLIAAYHANYASRVRSYGSLAAILADGFVTTDPAYKIAAAIFAQNPAPPTVKIGRRASAFTQTVRLVPVTPTAGMIFGVKVAGLLATYTADGTPTLAEACTGLAAAINALADADAIIATGASSLTLQALSGASLDGVTGRSVMSPARKLSLTLSSHADWDATTATVTGLDEAGNTISESFTIPNAGNTTVNGTKLFRRVTSVSIPAQSGTGGTFTLGVQAPVTASGVSGTYVACTSVAGELVSYERVGVDAAGELVGDEHQSNLGLLDVTADPGLATDLAAILTADPEWYGLLLDSQGADEVDAAATWTEANKRLLVWQSADTGAVSSDVITDVFSASQDAGYVRSAGIFHPTLAKAWIAAAWMGEELPKVEGASTWMFKSLATIPVYVLTDTERAALEAKDGNHYLSLAGVAVTGPGASSSGEWLDVVRDLDWLAARLREDALGVFLANDKVPFTDEGISLVLTALRARLSEAVGKNVLAPGFTLTAPKASAVSSTDKGNRHLPDVAWTGTLAGAIHSVAINGLVSL